MINLLLGLPGGGKSYEAVVYHVLPALQGGRKVITNLALDLAHIGALHPEYLPLIEIRTKTLKERPVVDWEKAQNLFQKFGIAAREPKHNDFPFSNLEDYGDPWRHPENGTGPLYVIDECHICLPRMGVPVKVEEWFSMHRHEFADVLLITQTYGKLNQAVRDIAQVVYRVKKATAFGSNTKYIRKVQDGLRGEVVNSSIREYKSQFFKYYRSNTKSGAGTELASQDIKPIWKNWTFVGAGICGLVLVVMFATMDYNNPLRPDLKVKANAATPDNSRSNRPQPSPDLVQTRLLENPAPGTEDIQPPGETLSSVIDDPYAEKGIHMTGHIVMVKQGRRIERWTFSISHNGQHMTNVSHLDLEGSGYTFTPHSECSGVLVIGKRRRPVSCDSPQIHLVPQSAVGGA